MRFGSRLSLVLVSIGGAIFASGLVMAQVPAAPRAILPPVVLPSDPETQIADAQQLALARKLVSTIGLDLSLTKIAKVIFDQAAKQFQTQGATLPEPKKRAAMAAFSSAASQAETRHIQRTIDYLTEYYATHISREQLENLLAIYSTSLGQKMVLSPQNLTREDREDAGRLVLAHPGALQAIPKMMGPMAEMSLWQTSEQRTFLENFRTDLCTQLDRIQVSFPTCRTAAAGGAPFHISPDDYPALAVRMHHEGVVRYHLEYGPDGAAINCTIIASSGYPELDDKTCPLLRRRSHAQTASAGTFDGSLSWKIPNR